MTKPSNGTSTKSPNRHPRSFPKPHNTEAQHCAKPYVQQFCKMANHIPATYRVGNEEFMA
jgi:hypothetical protein